MANRNGYKQSIWGGGGDGVCVGRGGHLESDIRKKRLKYLKLK